LLGGEVCEVSANGTIATVADEQILNNPGGLAVDSTGNVYIANTDSGGILEVSPSGALTIVAGNQGVSGYSGDGGPATSAQLSGPTGIALDAAGNIYFSDSGNNVVRQISPAGIIITVAGSGTQGYFGDGGAAVSAGLNQPSGVAVDGAANLYIADSHNRRVRMVRPDGTITTIAGNGNSGFLGDGTDGGAATKAGLSNPQGIAVGPGGTIYVTDIGRVRLLTPPNPPSASKDTLRSHSPSRQLE
jgi:hypothetical protein